MRRSNHTTARYTTSPVGELPANAFGLYDMHGNVWELCWDLHGAYADGAVTDPTGLIAGNARVQRGGGFGQGAFRCRSALRIPVNPADRENMRGFRVARTIGVGGGGPSATAAGVSTSDSASHSSIDRAGGFAWSKLIAASAIEDIVKGQLCPIERMTKTPGSFKSGGNHECRERYSVLAMLFSVISQYDGKVRWKKEAAGLRVAFGHVASNCKVGTDASFREAKLRSEDLGELTKAARSRRPRPKAISNGPRRSIARP